MEVLHDELVVTQWKPEAMGRLPLEGSIVRYVHYDHHEYLSRSIERSEFKHARL
jgi:hypothetical protein